jgi:hypothetical protein
MNDLHDQPTSPNSDPLERLVDAFIGQSVPEGPDDATQRRLLVAMGAADGARRVVVGSRSNARASRLRLWSRTLLQQTIGIAAAIAVVVAGAFYVANRGDDGPAIAVGVIEQPTTNINPQGGNSQGADPALDAPSTDVPVESVANQEATASQEVARMVETYLRNHGGQRPDRQAFNAMLADYLKDHPDLAKSESWQFAQDRLSYALDQPELLGVSVGLLGTLPWTSIGRF